MNGWSVTDFRNATSLATGLSSFLSRSAATGVPGHSTGTPVVTAELEASLGAGVRHVAADGVEVAVEEDEPAELTVRDDIETAVDLPLDGLGDRLVLDRSKLGVILHSLLFELSRVAHLVEALERTHELRWTKQAPDVLGAGAVDVPRLRARVSWVSPP